jgi:hypothetical protein
MRIAIALTTMLTALAASSFGQASTGASGSGPYAAPSAAAYSILENAAHKIVADNPAIKSKTVVLYDQQTFGMISTYQTAVEHMRKTLKALCQAPSVETPKALIPTLDIGGAASGLAALVTALTPSYAIQGQALPFDNSTLVAAFAKEVGANVVYPGYLLPAGKQTDVTCQKVDDATSLVDLWYGAAAQAATLRAEIDKITGTTDADKAKKKALQDKVDTYQKVAETYVAIDKGTSLLAKLLVVESLLRTAGVTDVPVIDLKLDAVGMESVTRTWLGTKKVSFAASVLAHYTLLTLTKTAGTFTLTPSRTDLVSIYLKVPNEDKFASSVTPRGVINGPNSQ